MSYSQEWRIKNKRMNKTLEFQINKMIRFKNKILEAPKKSPGSNLHHSQNGKKKKIGNIKINNLYWIKAQEKRRSSIHLSKKFKS